ncbi:MAG: hypothetical protein IJA61_01740 [Clostridia bacterium]|nr:hypothetical protein [Clostridia bacterium]
MNNEQKRETWFDRVDLRDIRSKFLGLKMLSNFPLEVLLEKTDVDGNPVRVFSVGNKSNKLLVAFNEFTYTYFGVVDKDKRPGLYPMGYIPTDLTDNRTKTWFELVSNANKGRTIDGKTYEEAFISYHQEKLNEKYDSKIENLKQQQDVLQHMRDKEVSEIYDFVGIDQKSIKDSEPEMAE